MIKEYKAYHKARGITFPVSEIDFRRKRIKGRHEDEIISARFDEVELTQEGVITFDNDFEQALISYERYSLGRRTYITGMCTDYITKFIGQLSNNTLNVMLVDIDHADCYGDDICDKPVWMEFKCNLEKEIQRRKEDGTWRL